MPYSIGRPAFWAVGAAVFLLSAVIRWSSVTSMRGDDHWPLWTAATFLKGDLPFRDFADLGDPLYWGLSAAAQWLVGYRVIGEVALGTVLASTALTLAFVLIVRATGSILLAVALTLVAAIVHGEAQLYGYSKLLIYPLVVGAAWRYIDQPTTRRSVALAAAVAAAFLFRHDHGAYAGAGAAAALAAAQAPDWRSIARSTGRFALTLGLMLLPFFATVQWSEGIVPYFAERIRIFALLDGENRRPVTFTADAAAPDHWIRIETPPPARVFVTWKSEVDEAMRASLERRYGLVRPPEPLNASEYALSNTRRDNIRAIVEDPHVYDTGLIDRERFTIAEESWIVDLYRALPMLRVSIAPRYWHRPNAGVMLHYLARSAPFLLLLVLCLGWMAGYIDASMPKAPQKMLVAALLAAVAFSALLRTIGYFEDHTALTAVLAGCLIGYTRQTFHARAPWVVRVGSSVATTLFVVAWVAGSLVYAEAHTSLKAMNDNWRGLWWQRSVEHFHAYSISPPIDQYAPRDGSERSLVRYVYECTNPDDRVWVMTEMFNFPYYTERRIVRHINWSMGFLNDTAQQRRTLEMLEADPVPLIISQGRREPMRDFEQYPLVHEYVSRRYTELHTVEGAQEGALNFYVLADGRRPQTREYGEFGLPCFR